MYRELLDYLGNLVETRLKGPGDDLISKLVIEQVGSSIFLVQKFLADDPNPILSLNPDTWRNRMLLKSLSCC